MQPVTGMAAGFAAPPSYGSPTLPYPELVLVGVAVGDVTGAGMVMLSDACEVEPRFVVATTFRVWVPADAETVATRLVELEELATKLPSKYACICLVLLRLEVALTRKGDATELPAAGAVIVTAAWAAHKDKAMHTNVRLNKLGNSRVFFCRARVAGRGRSRSACYSGGTDCILAVSDAAEN